LLQVLKQQAGLRSAAKKRRLQPLAEVFALQVGEGGEGLPEDGVGHCSINLCYFTTFATLMGEAGYYNLS
jgi:hypothetical protein